MRTAFELSETLPETRRHEWRMFTDPACSGWEWECYVGSDTQPAATIEVGSDDVVRQVTLGADFAVNDEATIVEGRDGPFTDVHEAGAAIEALLRLTSSYSHNQ